MLAEGDEYGGMPPEVFELRALQELHLSQQAMRFIPNHIHKLTNLHTLNLNRCVCLESIAGALGFLPKLNSKYGFNSLFCAGAGNIWAWNKFSDLRFTFLIKDISFKY